MELTSYNRLPGNGVRVIGVALRFHPPGVLLAYQVLVVVDHEQENENGLKFTFVVLGIRLTCDVGDQNSETLCNVFTQPVT